MSPPESARCSFRAGARSRTRRLCVAPHRARGRGDTAIVGFRSTAYICPAGVWTIGWGATRDLAGNRVTKDTPDVDEAEAEEILARDLGKFAGAVDRLVSVSIGPRQRAALTSFAFNLGAGQLRSSTLLRKVNGDEWQDVPREFMKWVMGGGRVLPGLQRRRRMEADLWSEEA